MSDLWKLLACPACGAPLDGRADLITCSVCEQTYPVVDGIPVLIAHQLASQQEAQVGFFDDADREWEIMRPHDAPRWHRSLLDEKLTRSVSKLASLLPGSTAVAVCGGSGMEAEFLARRGAQVVSVDLSLQAARRARERGRRNLVPIFSIVAAAERLPFADRSVDVAFVHDGLHHLENPFVGVAEMVRVAKRAVSINEPAKAVATALAIRFRVAEEVEDAGNRVARLDIRELVAALRREDFVVVCAERYAMFYRHEPGLPSRLLSSRGLFAAARAGLVLANALVGRRGNKLTVQAVR